MIYLDTSVALAHLLAEDRQPPESIWAEHLVSSRLLEYEVFTRIHARQLGEPHTGAARELLACVSLLELAPPVLERALAPFPCPVRTLDALHLASMVFLRGLGQDVWLACYDRRLSAAAEALGFRPWTG